VSQKVLATLLSKNLPKTAKLKQVYLEKEHSGHTKNITFTPEKGQSLQIKATTFRKHLNRAFQKEVVRSLLFDAHLNEEQELILKGKGWGYHGIGLCQFGSKKLAKLKRDFKEILMFYYPNASMGNTLSDLPQDSNPSSSSVSKVAF
jgi:SpoIID/LytB domain protein